MQISADVTGRPVGLLRIAGTSTLGAAMLATVGVGVYSAIHEAT